MKKIAYILTIVSLLYTQAFAAYNPFDVLRQNNLPDFTISDIYQETNSDYVAMKVCNIGGSMDKDGDIALGIKNNNSGLSTNTLIKYIRFASGDCNSYRVGTARSIGVYSGDQYNIKGGVKLNYYRGEQNSYNNSRESNIYLSAGTYNSSSYNSNSYNSNDRYYCNGARYNYNNNADTIYYCNGNWYARNSNNNSNTYINGSDQYYCNGKYYTYSNNATSYYCNGTRYSRNSNNSNYNNSSYNSSDKYYCGGTRYNYNSTADTAYYCNGTRYPRNNNSNYNYNNSNQYYCGGTRYNYSNTSDTSYYCNGSWYSRNNNYNYYNNNGYNTYYTNDYSYTKADLEINTIYLNKFNRQVITRVCNKGGAMGSSYNLKTTFYSKNTGRTVTKNTSINLGANSCTSEEIYADVFELGLYYNGTIEITSNIQLDNYAELSLSNNEKTTSISIDYN